jgi:hypothetical protein
MAWVGWRQVGTPLELRQLTVAPKWPAIVVKVVERLVPKVDTAVMMTTAINAAIKPYSRAVTPRLSRPTVLNPQSSVDISFILNGG